MAGLAGSAGTGHIGTVQLSLTREEKMKRAKEEDVKAIWEISEKFFATDEKFFATDGRIVIGGGRREDPKTTWEEAYEDLQEYIFSN